MLPFKNIKNEDENEDAYHKSVQKMDLAELQIKGEIDPERVNLRVTSCFWVDIEAMETKCQPGDSFSIKQVPADDLLSLWITRHHKQFFLVTKSITISNEHVIINVGVMHLVVITYRWVVFDDNSSRSTFLLYDWEGHKAKPGPVLIISISH